MGKLEVRGNSSKTVDYDLMKIKLDFHAKEKTATEASKKVMRECEEFLVQRSTINWTFLMVKYPQLLPRIYRCHQDGISSDIQQVPR